MKTPKIKLVFDRKNNADDWKSKKRSRLGLLQMELYFDGKRKWYSTGISLYKGQWDDIKRVINHPDSAQLNQRLYTLMMRANESITTQLANGSFSVGEFDKVFQLASTSETSLLDAVWDVKTMYEKAKKSYSAIMQYSGLHGKLLEYNKTAKNKLRRIEDCTYAAIEEFDAWMVGDDDLERATAWVYHCKLRHTIKDYLEKHTIKGFESPYKAYKVERPKEGKVKYLTEDEVDKIINLELTDEVDIFTRDVFLFQRYTGLSNKDALAIRKELDVEYENGKYILRKDRIKTTELFAIILLPPAIAVLDKYGGRLDLYTLQTINTHLHKIERLAGIPKSITSHVARHTFATYALNHGVQLEYVQKMLGHKSIITTQRYAKALALNVLAEFDKL